MLTCNASHKCRDDRREHVHTCTDTHTHTHTHTHTYRFSHAIFMHPLPFWRKREGLEQALKSVKCPPSTLNATNGVGMWSVLCCDVLTMRATSHLFIIMALTRPGMADWFVVYQKVLCVVHSAPFMGPAPLRRSGECVSFLTNNKTRFEGCCALFLTITAARSRNACTQCSVLCITYIYNPAVTQRCIYTYVW